LGAKRQLVVFRVGSEEFAVDIMLTNEVVLMREITPVPETEGYVEGVMNLRGNLVPVLDFRKRLRALGTAESARSASDDGNPSREVAHWEGESVCAKRSCLAATL